jgi:membrane associated rhomboid family serine protease
MIYDRAYMNEPDFRRPWSLSFVLVLVNTAVFALDLLARLSPASPLARFFGVLQLFPGDIARGWIWQLLTFQFLHGGLLHLVLNCATLYIFGRMLESTLGPRVFLVFYLGCGAFGGLFQTLFCWVFPTHFGPGPFVGASAGVCGLVAAFAVLNRNVPVTSFQAILPITMPAQYLLVVEAVISVLGMLDPGSRIAHAAHLGGMVAALASFKLRPWLDFNRWHWPRIRRAPAHPELVKTTVVFGGTPRRQRPSPGDGRSTPDFIREEVDPILEKISAHGIQSLTERERRILDQARARME